MTAGTMERQDARGAVGQPRLADLPEIVSRNRTAEVIGKSACWLWRRRSVPIYAPNADGSYSRRQIELIVDVLSGVHEADYAYKILKAERDAKRAQGAMTIANAEKLRHKREKAGAAVS